MQVERSFVFDLIFLRKLKWKCFRESGRRASNTYLTCPKAGDNIGNGANPPCAHRNENTVCKDLSLWEGDAAYQVVGWGKGSPSRWRVADLRGCTAAMGLRHGPYSYGRQQWGILDNGGNSDPAIPRGGWRLTGCKLLFWGKTTDGTSGIRNG